MAGQRPSVTFPVNIRADDHPQLVSHLEAGLLEERQSQVLSLIESKDWPDFEKRRGLILGLDAALALCQSARKKLEG